MSLAAMSSKAVVGGSGQGFEGAAAILGAAFDRSRDETDEAVTPAPGNRAPLN